MNVTSKITVDMTRQNVGQRVNAMQGDVDTRAVEITLLAGGKHWEPPEGVEAAIAYMQPGGTKGLYNKLADGTAAISISGNVVTIILAPQMLTASGTVQASLVFNDQQLNRLTTFPFAVSVTSNPAAGAQKVEDYIRLQWLEDKLDEYLRKAADSGAFDGAPGADGKTPEYGVDYGTPEQITDIANKAAGILSDDIQKISAGKVDKAEGMGLSSNDYDNAAKAKVDAIPEDPKYTDTVYDDTEVKQGLSHIKDDLSDNAEADAETRRKLDYLWKLNQGISYQFETDDTEAYSKTVPTGAKLAAVEAIGGHTESIDGELVSAVVESVVDRGQNLFDESTVIQNKYITTSGGIGLREKLI